MRIFKLTEPQNNAASTPRYGQFSPAANAKQRNSQRHMQIELVAAFNDHHAEVRLGSEESSTGLTTNQPCHLFSGLACGMEYHRHYPILFG